MVSTVPNWCMRKVEKNLEGFFFSWNDNNTQGKLGAKVIENLMGEGAANKVYYGEYANGEHKLNPNGGLIFPESGWNSSLVSYLSGW